MPEWLVWITWIAVLPWMVVGAACLIVLVLIAAVLAYDTARSLYLRAHWYVAERRQYARERERLIALSREYHAQMYETTPPQERAA